MQQGGGGARLGAVRRSSLEKGKIRANLDFANPFTYFNLH